MPFAFHSIVVHIVLKCVPLKSWYSPYPAPTERLSAQTLGLYVCETQ